MALHGMQSDGANRVGSDLRGASAGWHQRASEELERAQRANGEGGRASEPKPAGGLPVRWLVARGAVHVLGSRQLHPHHARRIQACGDRGGVAWPLGADATAA